MSRKLTRVAAALALALGSTIAITAPASAEPRLITCPNTGSLLFPRVNEAWTEVQQRGRMVDAFRLSDSHAQDFYVDGRFERWVFGGGAVMRLCYDSRPPRPEGARDMFNEPRGSGGGSGGYASLGANVWYVGSSMRVGIVTVGTVEDLR